MNNKIANAISLIVFASIMFAALLFFTPLAVNATSSNSQVVASVNVPGTLYTNITPNSVSWTNYPTYSNATNTLITVKDINGNIPGNIFIWGSAYLSNALNGNSIAIGNVLWNPTSVNTYTGTHVTTSPVNTMILVTAPSLSSPSTSNNIYLGVSIPAGTPSGVYTGSIYFDIENGTIVSSQPSSNTLSVSVNVLSTCFISLNATAINFGTIPTGQNTGYSWNGILDTDNGGNAQATIYVYGSNWIYSPNPSISFYVSNTVWSASNTLSYSQNFPTNSLALTPTSTGITVPAPTQANPSQSAKIYFGLGVPGGAPVGAYTQNIIIADQC